MPIQSPQWTEYLSCPVCENGFDLKSRLPISLGCGHSICQTCLAQLRRKLCPFDQGAIRLALNQMPINTALVLLIDPDKPLDKYRVSIEDAKVQPFYTAATAHLEKLANFLRPSSSRQQLSRPMQRKLVTLINCQLLEEEGKARVSRAARSLGERSVTELILQHQNPQQLSANLWAAVRARGCQFLGPAMQEEVLKLVLLALEDGSALSRKVLVMFVVQRLEPHFPQASKTSIGHVVQLLYRASCFKVTKRDGDSSLMQLKEDFRTYDTLRREHDAQIVQIATEAGLRIAPDQWSSLLYGDTSHKSHMQSIIDKLQTPQSFLQSVQELVIALQRTGDPGQLGLLRPHLDFLAGLDPSPESQCPDWETLTNALSSVLEVVTGLQTFIEQHSSSRRNSDPSSTAQQMGANSGAGNSRYKTSLCRDLSTHGSCPRGKNCTFAHSQVEMEQYRSSNRKSQPQHTVPPPVPGAANAQQGSGLPPPLGMKKELGGYMHGVPHQMTPVAQVAPLQRGYPVAAPLHPMGVPVIQQGGAQQSQQHNQPPPQLPPHVVPMDIHYAPGGNEGVMPHPPPTIVNHQMSYQTNPPSDMGSGGLMAAPLSSLVNPRGAVQFVAGPPGNGGSMLTTYTTEHDSNAEIYPPRSEVCLDVHAVPSVGMATKSLGALRSRKEEIMDSLQDLVGKEEAKKIHGQAAEKSPVIHQGHSGGKLQQNNYSIWTSRSIATLPAAGRKGSGSGEMMNCPSSIYPTPKDDVHAKNVDDLVNDDDLDGEIDLGNETDDERASITDSVNVAKTWSTTGIGILDEDDVIPFSDTPQICRFGPISRKAGTLLQLATPSQSTAIINDEPTPTAVVRHSKQLTRQVPSLAALYHQNGSRTTLQPVAVGVNGEIGYIAVPESHMPPPDLTLQQIQQSSTFHQQSPSPTHPSHSLYAESERMKHELELLQKKISDLNMAHNDKTGAPAPGNVNVPPVEPKSKGLKPEETKERDDLASELRMIESTIRDREQEITVNHQRMTTGGAGSAGEVESDYGSFAASSGELSSEGSSLSTSPTASLTSDASIIGGGSVGVIGDGMVHYDSSGGGLSPTPAGAPTSTSMPTSSSISCSASMPIPSSSSASISASVAMILSSASLSTSSAILNTTSTLKAYTQTTSSSQNGRK